MCEKRVQVYGRDAEGNRKHGFDLLVIDGKPYIESMYKNHLRVKTPVENVLAALKKLLQGTE